MEKRKFAQTNNNQLHHRSNTSNNNRNNNLNSTGPPKLNSKEQKDEDSSYSNNKLKSTKIYNGSHCYYYKDKSITRKRTIKSLTIKLLILIYIFLTLVAYFLAIDFKNKSVGDDFKIRDWFQSKNLTRSKRFMIVVAHPDDECLFFSPTILNLLTPRVINITKNSNHGNETRVKSSKSLNRTSKVKKISEDGDYQEAEGVRAESKSTRKSEIFDEDDFDEDDFAEEKQELKEIEILTRNEDYDDQNYKVDPYTMLERPTKNNRTNSTTVLFQPWGHVLSLSSGDADGLGIIRAREMRASCWALGITSSKCIAVDHPELPDSMKVWWPEKKILEFVRVYIDLWKIDTIITFDHGGVSGHANHRAIATAITRAVHTDPKFPPTYLLRSTSLLSKYGSILTLPYAIINHHLTRKLIFSTFDRPDFHPSLDSKKIKRLVKIILNKAKNKNYKFDRFNNGSIENDRSVRSRFFSSDPSSSSFLKKSFSDNIVNHKAKKRFKKKLSLGNEGSKYDEKDEGLKTENSKPLRDSEEEDSEDRESTLGGSNLLNEKKKRLIKLKKKLMLSFKRRQQEKNLSTHQSFFLSDLNQYYESRRAFNQHRSQKVWFRRLWLIFSRYMWINELYRVVPIEFRFKINDDELDDDENFNLDEQERVDEVYNDGYNEGDSKIKNSKGQGGLFEKNKNKKHKQRT